MVAKEESRREGTARWHYAVSLASFAEFAWRFLFSLEGASSSESLAVYIYIIRFQKVQPACHTHASSVTVSTESE